MRLNNYAIQNKAFGALLCLMAIGCQYKVPDGLFDKVPAPTLTSFSVNGVAGVISGDTITVDLRWRSASANFNVKSVAPTFVVSTGMKVNGVKQISGVSTQDFTSPKTYALIGIDTPGKDYQVQIKYGFPFADTGFTQCASGFDGDGALGTCPQTVVGQDGDAQNKPATRSFTGPTQHSTYTADYITVDNITGFVWKSCSEGQTGAACSGAATDYTMDPNTATPACTALNSLNGGNGYGGRTNWRLPSIEELSTLANFGVSVAPTIDSIHFPGTPLANYWASTLSASDATSAWFLTTGVPTQYTTNIGATGQKVRCIAADAASYSPTRTDNADGTITDQGSNLVWTKCSMDNTGTGTLQTFASGCTNTAAGTRLWKQAILDCNGLTLGGRSWRLPNVRELSSTVNTAVFSPATETAFFPATTGTYWTSTSRIDITGRAFTISYTEGTVGWSDKTVTPNRVRCVSGP